MFKILKSIIRSAGQGIASDPHVKKFREKHPKLFHFLRQRLSSNEKFGLYLTLGTIITLIFIFLFFGVLQDLIGQDPLVQSDLRLINLVQIFRSPFFNHLMLFITYLGEWQIVFVGLFFISIILVLARRWAYLAALIVSAVGSEGLVWLIKNLIERPRPPLTNALLPETGFSFPSGHAFIAFSFYGLATYFIFRSLKNKALKIITVISGLIVILAIGFSRIYLGVHWPSDVLASYASGAAWITFIITAIEIRKKFYPKRQKEEQPHIKSNLLISLGLTLFIAWVVFWVLYCKMNPLKQPTAVLETPQIISEQNVAQTLFASLPRTSEEITGKPMEPINIIIIGSEADLKQAFTKANWLPVDPIKPSTIWHFFYASILNLRYDQAPGTPSFWNARPNDFAFEQPTDTVRERHHIHFWQTQFTLDHQASVWLGTAHYDQTVSIKTSLFPIHKIDPAVDKERAKVKNDLINSGLVNQVTELQIVEPTLGKNQAGDQFFTDGKAYLIFLR